MANGANADWVALLPVKLSNGAKRVLETIEHLGMYRTGASFTAIDRETLEFLEEREFVEAFRAFPGAGTLVYRLTETGRLWLKSCRQVECTENAEEEDA